jgi:hypothetical protein
MVIQFQKVLVNSNISKIPTWPAVVAELNDGQPLFGVALAHADRDTPTTCMHLF